MAIYHMAVKTVKRSSGRSAPGAAAYRAAALIVDARTGISHDFTAKAGVVSSDIVLPRNVPAWSSDRSALWNAAEYSETRKNSVVAREFEVALPHELSEADRRRLALNFAREIVSRHQCAVEVCIHDPSRGGDGRNVHAHILLSTRRLDPYGFGNKTRELDDRKSGEVKRWRKRWGTLQNEALARAGVDARVDHRSLADQRAAALEAGDLEMAMALEREPQRHVGVHATAMDRRAGRSISERGQARERAVMDGHRAAFSAEARSRVAVDAERVAAKGIAAGGDNDGALKRPGRALQGPSTAAESPAAPVATENRVVDGPIWAGGGPASNGAGAVERPATLETSMSDHAEAGMVHAPAVADLRAKIALFSRGLTDRLNDLPEVGVLRRRVETLAVDYRRAIQDLEDARAGIAESTAAFDHWKRQHRWQSLFRFGRERRDMLTNIEGWRTQLERARQSRDEIAQAGRPLEKELANLIAQHRSAVEAAASKDAAELPALQAALAAAEEREAAVVPAYGPSNAARLGAAPAPALEINKDKVAAFRAGMVGASPGPGFALQAAYDAVVGKDRALFTRKMVERELSAEEWASIGTEGARWALAAGNSVADVREVLAVRWPGDAGNVDELVHQAMAQRVVDQVLEAVEAGAAPLTDDGRQLVELVRSAPDEAAARGLVAADLDFASRALAEDRGLSIDQESDRPAPQLS